ncbi:MAG: hypothetical protein KFW09_05825, partial [Oscillospiraceae bacterium]|nr:hypothetical protein [Oscillospiraceae bacterium]
MPKPNLKDLFKGKSKKPKDKDSSVGSGQNSDIDPRQPSTSRGYSISSRAHLDSNSGPGGATGGQPPRNPYAGGATGGGQPPRNPYAGGATGGQPPRNPYAGGA